MTSPFKRSNSTELNARARRPPRFGEVEAAHEVAAERARPEEHEEHPDEVEADVRGEALGETDGAPDQPPAIGAHHLADEIQRDRAHRPAEVRRREDAAGLAEIDVPRDQDDGADAERDLQIRAASPPPPCVSSRRHPRAQSSLAERKASAVNARIAFSSDVRATIPRDEIGASRGSDAVIRGGTYENRSTRAALAPGAGQPERRRGRGARLRGAHAGEDRVADGRRSLPSFAALAQQVMPAVVNINTTKNIPARTQRRQYPRGQDPFEQFFGEDFWERFGGRRGPVEAAQPRLRLRDRRLRLHRHQPPRRRRRRRHRRAVLDRQAVQGEARRRGRQDRRRALEDQARGQDADRAARRLRPACRSATGCSPSATRSGSRTP